MTVRRFKKKMYDEIAKTMAQEGIKPIRRRVLFMRSVIVMEARYRAIMQAINHKYPSGGVVGNGMAWGGEYVLPPLCPLPMWREDK